MEGIGNKIRIGEEEGYMISIKGNIVSYYNSSLDEERKKELGDMKELVIKNYSIEKTTKKETYFPIYIGETIVYYANDGYDAKRYMSTKKYMEMSKWFERFKKYDKNYQKTLRENLVKKCIMLLRSSDEEIIKTLNEEERKLFKSLLLKI